MSKNIFEEFATPLSALSADHNLYAAKSDGSEGRIPLGDLFNTSAVPTLNPVADKAALDALAITNLTTGVHCWVIAELSYYYFNGTTWVISPTSHATSFSDHDAFVDYVGGKPDVYASLKAAIDAGAEYPAIIANGTETEEITLTKSVVITLMIARVTFNARFNHAGFDYTISGQGRFLSNISYNPSGPGASESNDNGLFFGNEPQGVKDQALFTFLHCGYSNVGSHANTPLLSEGFGSVVSFDNTCVPGAADNAGIRYTGLNSKSAFLVLGAKPSSTNAIVASYGEHESWTVTNSSGTPGQNLITLTDQNVILNNVFSNTAVNYNFKITSGASISNLKANSVSYVDLEATGTAGSLSNVKLGSGSTLNKGAEGVVIKSVVGCDATTVTGSGTFGYRAANNSAIGNDYHDSSGFDEFTALLDNSSSSDPKYIGVSQAYAANKFYALTVDNVTETALTELANGKQFYLKIGQNYTWNMADKTIKGVSDSLPNGVQFTVEMADTSSVLEYDFPASEYPFTNFDLTSTLVIKGNGGVINNVSTVDGSSINAVGRIIAKDLLFNLPNQSDGGIHSSENSLIENIVFNGGGIACDRAFNANGGNIKNIYFSGSYLSNAILNDADAHTNISGVYFGVAQPATLQLNGNSSDINAISGSNLMLNVLSHSAVCNAFVSSAVLLEGVVDCYFSNANFSDTASLASDNSNDTISFVNCTFEQEVLVYGTNINFTNCHFNGGIQTMSGSTGSIVGSDSATAIVNNGTFRREANDSNIGNDYNEPGRTVTVTNAMSPYAALWGDILIGDATDGDIIIDIPTAVGNSHKTIVAVKKDVSSNTITYSANGSENIFGDTTLSQQHEGDTIYSNGTDLISV